MAHVKCNFQDIALPPENCGGRSNKGNQAKLDQMLKDLDEVLKQKPHRKPLKYKLTPKYQKATINHKKK